MLLWLIFAVLSAGVVAFLVRPLVVRRDSPAFRNDAPTTAVYKDQLSEIEADLQRGLIGETEAGAARTEIARRLLATGTPQGQPAAPDTVSDASAKPGEPVVEATRPAGRARFAAVILMVLIPATAIAAYIATGTPFLPAQPFAQRPDVAMREAQAKNRSRVERLVAAVEQRLKENPDDGKGWDVIAPVYLQLSRYPDALHAFQRSIALNGDSMKRLAGLAEASMLVNSGRIQPEARTAFAKMLKLDPGNVEARFWLAQAKEQDGRLAEAEADYRSLLATAPPDASWRPMVEKHLAELTGTRAPSPPDAQDRTAQATPPDARGPTAADVATARNMTASERSSMIAGMVQNLADRLDKDGHDLEGWKKLVRAYVVLGRKDDAIAALGRARSSLKDEPQSLASLAA
ncbi:MAG: c-type cytochrome biogenesis protein CcmI, partial [Hyphomicrobiaceae bacterium]